ncbi:MAG: CxxxxCH/CxxCH domain-containing protein [Deltaproteobacteria bacterium]|nr:CxxxxCH/CxxCH domain-containing protein [Deltaproteobacteria bacterium]
MGASRTLTGLALIMALGAAAQTSLSCLERRELQPQPAAANPCTACHGSAERPGSVEAQAAPPIDLAGNTDPSAPGVGAHEHHLLPSATHGAIACAECHVVPTATDSPGHADTALPAEVELTGLAALGDRSPAYGSNTRTCADTYCHGEATPEWTDPRASAQACGSCHGMPPPLPHPQRPNCWDCHGEVIGEGLAFLAPERHVDGEISASFTCHSCHGSPESNAPPQDLAGSSDVASIGVGAHQAHLTGSALAAAVPCTSCHAVPTTVDAGGHLDDALPAEVVFAGAATADGRSPTWDRDTRLCSQSWCHGPSSEATASPDWTAAAGPLSCASCHSFPPVAPHPDNTACGGCHQAVVGSNGAIINPALHVDGTVQLGP